MNFCAGMIYALIHFLQTPKATLLERRLWAYEYWLIFGFYAIFLLLAIRFPKRLIKPRADETQE